MASVIIRLCGGPGGLADEKREVTLSDDDAAGLDDRFVVQYRAGYEHFAFRCESRGPRGTRVRFYDWLYQTKIAE
ncbi:DUF5988 family protein [Streptomyces xanthochromogenes]|uniref:DUF5988 family protein n=1 Tax=Streptomyces xanthochromogenes TaxID=67384 RepID=UPI0038010658